MKHRDVALSESLMADFPEVPAMQEEVRLSP